MASMFIMNRKNCDDIDAREKVGTLRPLNPSGKGYFKAGRSYWVHLGRNFKTPHYARILINTVDFVDVEALTLQDFHRLGYSSKAEYLAESFNISNPSSQRVAYWFETLHTIEDLKDWAESFEITPEAYHELYELAKAYKIPVNDCDPSAVFDGCDPDLLALEWATLESDIKGVEL